MPSHTTISTGQLVAFLNKVNSKNDNFTRKEVCNFHRFRKSYRQKVNFHFFVSWRTLSAEYSEYCSTSFWLKNNQPQDKPWWSYDWRENLQTVFEILLDMRRDHHVGSQLRQQILRSSFAASVTFILKSRHIR